MNIKKTGKRTILPRVSALGLVLLLILAAGSAGAADLDITISKDMLQRFLNALTPYHIDYEPIEGIKAAEVVFQNPRLVLEPGSPGRVFLEFDYEAQSAVLGLDRFKGTTRPQLQVTYLPKQSALKLEAVDFRVQAGEKMKFRLDGFLPPYYLLVSPQEPLQLDGEKVNISTKSFRIEVTEKGIRILADYTFERLP